jgi:hypothetical protein
MCLVMAWPSVRMLTFNNASTTACPSASDGCVCATRDLRKWSFTLDDCESQFAQ